MIIGDTRKVEVKLGDGTWSQIEFNHIKKGDVFRMFESTGELVDDDAESIALEDATPTSTPSMVRVGGKPMSRLAGDVHAERERCVKQIGLLDSRMPEWVWKRAKGNLEDQIERLSIAYDALTVKT